MSYQPRYLAPERQHQHKAWKALEAEARKRGDDQAETARAMPRDQEVAGQEQCEKEDELDHKKEAEGKAWQA